MEIKPSYGLTDEEIERMLIESFEHAEDDLARRNLQIERVEAERILAATRNAVATDDGLLDDDTRAATLVAMAELERIAAGTDHHAILAEVEALDLASKPFAQARMNRVVDAAMRGKTIDEVEHDLSPDAAPGR